MTYTTINHLNSRTSERRGLLWKFNQLTGRTEPVNHTTRQLIRDSSGSPAPHMHTPAVIRAFRSKHEPHIGNKQLAKSEQR